ncbi:TlpA family protein disulfide reductase [Flavobacterium sp. TMP13]|uniref:TlpA family protein disulfide reductase n=1 Tax=Flavobacterium sp. TMP13 TaxID=3425950 RepID=UPI003D76C300
MLKKVFSTLLLLCFSISYGQNTNVAFSRALQLNIRPYIKASNKAFRDQNFTEGVRLFDSLVNYKLVGTQFDDFTVKNLSSKKITLSKIGKPVFIITYASWCIINKGDIPALNKIVEEQHGDLEVLVFFWGTRADLQKTSRFFHKKIQICYTDTSENENYELVTRLKNTLGFPTSYFIDSNQKVLSINRISNPFMGNITLEQATEQSYKNFISMINTVRLKNNSVVLPLVEN